MAAVLCSACGDICGSTCSVCSKACGGLSDVFGDVCQNCATACASPFSIVVTVAAMFNVPCVYLGVQEITDLQCRGSQWLFVNGLFGAGNIAAAIYMAMVVAKADDDPSDIENPNTPRRPPTAFGRAGHLLCYDPIMAMYLLALMAFICWLWTGGIWMLNGKSDNGCSEGVEGRIVAALSFAWAFLFCGVGALGCGMCCAACGVGDNSRNNASSVPNYGAATATTPFVNVDNIPDSTKKDAKGGATLAPVAVASVAAATPSAAATAPSAPAKQEEIPTVKATLF